MKCRVLRWGLVSFLLIIGFSLTVGGIILILDTVIVIEWSTVSEFDTLGFNLYRSQKNGEVMKLNDQLIPSSNSPLTGGSYQYRDNSVKTNQTYTYILKEFTTNGDEFQIGEISAEVRVGGITESLIGFIILATGIIALISLIRSKQEKLTSK